MIGVQQKQSLLDMPLLQFSQPVQISNVCKIVLPPVHLLNLTSHSIYILCQQDPCSIYFVRDVTHECDSRGCVSITSICAHRCRNAPLNLAGSLFTS